MGFGGRKFESPRPTLQTSLCEEDGRSARKEEDQNCRTKYSSNFGFELAASTRSTSGGATWRVAFDLPLITLHFPANENLCGWRCRLHRQRLLRALAE